MRLLPVIIIAAAFSFTMQAQDNCCKDGGSKNETKITKGEDIVRKGEINLTAIDKNKDGKVFQDQMCWNVISDKPGNCPMCKMELKEVTLETAKKNLIKNNFKVVKK